MNARRKSALAGGLGVLAAAVWIPQFLARGGGAPIVQLEVGAEPIPDASEVPPASSEAEPVESADAPAAGEPADTAHEEAAPETEVAAEPVTSEEMGRISALEEELQALEPRDFGQELAALFARLDAGDEGVDEPVSIPLLEPAEDAGEDARTWLAAFAEQNPLVGLVYRPDRSAALLGHRVVRSGDILLGGKVTVVAIGPGWVELAHEGESAVVELNAFRARSGTDDGVQQQAPSTAEGGA